MKKETKKIPANNLKKWSDQDKEMLRVLTDRGLSLKDTGKILGRTPEAVSYQRNVLGYRAPGYAPRKVKVVKSVNPVAVNKTAEVKIPVGNNSSSVTRDRARDITRAAREIARANGKRITMAMFFVEDL